MCAADVAQLANDPAVRTALEAAKRIEPEILAEQRRVCEIAAPSFQEQKRGLEFERIFKTLGLKNVRIDEAGDVIGERPGKSAHPNLVLAAHLDTVFPAEVDVHNTMTGTKMKGPGIGDDCRGLAVLIGVIRSLDEAKVVTPGTITFVANVGEEGLGDLRGVKQLFDTSLKGKIDNFISIDGTGLHATRIGVGSYRYKVTFTGPGGHSFGSFGNANPIHAMGRAIAKISDFQVTATPKVTFNVGRIGGGTSVNSIAYESWAEVDMRSSDAASLKAIDDKFKAAVQLALNEENERWKNKGKIAVEIKLLGYRPAGETPESAPIVQTAKAVGKALGYEVRLGEGSTDSNYPMSFKAPAITIGGGGTGTGAHSLDEAFDSTDSWKGTQRALLLAVALVQ
jgi:tripeptide aminopeptidase